MAGEVDAERGREASEHDRRCRFGEEPGRRSAEAVGQALVWRAGRMLGLGSSKDQAADRGLAAAPRHQLVKVVEVCGGGPRARV